MSTHRQLSQTVPGCFWYQLSFLGGLESLTHLVFVCFELKLLVVISFTSYGWPSQNNLSGFLNLTAHWINKAWQRQSAFLSLHLVIEKHTAHVSLSWKYIMFILLNQSLFPFSWPGISWTRKSYICISNCHQTTRALFNNLPFKIVKTWQSVCTVKNKTNNDGTSTHFSVLLS